MSAKVSERYLCSACGAVSLQWLGQCPKCGQWNSLAPAPAGTGQARPPQGPGAQALRLSEAPLEGHVPFSTGLEALDRLLGSGLVPGSLVLAGGEPGVGKSTLLLQVAGGVAAGGAKALYASGEEQLAQIRARAERLGLLSDGLLALAPASLYAGAGALEGVRPGVVGVDAVQCVGVAEGEGLPGNASQVRAVATTMVELCRRSGAAGVLVGHVTKDGSIAGPRLLEHMVDVVLSLEGDRGQAFRVLRIPKNRFGPSGEMLVFRMGSKGMELVDDPATFFLEDRNPGLSGSAVVMSLDGRRPLAVEVQALVSPTHLSIPRRVALGFDVNRLNLLLAVLEKRLRLDFSQADVYAKVGGGLRLQDPGLDLGLVAALLSSWYDRPLPERAVFFGETDLNGQVRPVACQDERLLQARRLGFSPLVAPGSVGTVGELAGRLFGPAGRGGRG